MRKIKVLAVVMMIAAMIVGCGSKEVPMKEFASNDGSCTIQLNEKWVVEETGMDNWIAAFNELGTEGAMVMQFTKGIMDANVSNVSDIKAIVEESYVMSGMEAIEVESGILSNVEAYKCSMDVDGIDGEGCVAYGETDYAYYVILSLESGSTSDKAVEAFKTSVASLTESAQ
ncbi:MAG: hypothetical protein IJ409_10125 [Lachnospiraceae bacterium]|nr:hypothetical protein [Lachnospiraceae bacterium]